MSIITWYNETIELILVTTRVSYMYVPSEASVIIHDFTTGSYCSLLNFYVSCCFMSSNVSLVYFSSLLGPNNAFKLI